jgi:hypothetical protein
MKTVFKYTLLLVVTYLIVLVSPSLPIVFAQQTATGCFTTQLGTPNGTPVMPQGCDSGIIGVETPPGLIENPGHPGYFQMPLTSPDKSYVISTCAQHTYGSKLLVSVIYTVAKNWKVAHPQGMVYINDMTAAGHLSHMWGRAVDINATTNGTDHVSDDTKGNFNSAGSIEFAMMFLKTKKVLNIWDSRVSETDTIKAQARAQNLPFTLIEDPSNVPGIHHDHIHVDVISPQLPDWSPAC